MDVSGSVSVVIKLLLVAVSLVVLGSVSVELVVDVSELVDEV